jgi:hypothetical protein
LVSDGVQTERKHPALAQKILQHDDHVQKRLNLLDSLLGNSKVAQDIRGAYVPMILNSNVTLVHGRGTGMGKLKQIRKLGESTHPSALKTKLLLRVASSNNTSRVQGRTR